VEITRDLTTEEGKIDYLLERIRGSKLIFVRNKVEYVGPAAASFLHWKLDRWRSRHYAKITTAQEFVNLITRGSKVSGEPYSAILKDGTRHDLQNVLQNELDALEACLKQLPPNSPEMNTQNLTQSATEVSSVKADIQKDEEALKPIMEKLTASRAICLDNFEFLSTKM
jgi:hypothetical protein